jgi:hypothetical protein
MDWVDYKIFQISCRNVTILHPQPIEAITNEVLIKDIEFILTVFEKGMLEQFVDDEVADVKVFHEAGASVVNAQLDEIFGLAGQLTWSTLLCKPSFSDARPVDNAVTELDPCCNISPWHGQIAEDLPVFANHLCHGPFNSPAAGVNILRFNWYTIPNGVRLSCGPVLNLDLEAFR